MNLRENPRDEEKQRESADKARAKTPFETELFDEADDQEQACEGETHEIDRRKIAADRVKEKIRHDRDRDQRHQAPEIQERRLEEREKIVNEESENERRDDRRERKNENADDEIKKAVSDGSRNGPRKKRRRTEKKKDERPREIERPTNRPEGIDEHPSEHTRQFTKMGRTHVKRVVVKRFNRNLCVTNHVAFGQRNREIQKTLLA